MKRKEVSSDAADKPVRLVTCDVLGLVKGIEAPSLSRLGEAKVVNSWGEPDRGQNAAHCLALIDQAEGSATAAVGRTNGSVSMLDAQSGESRATLASDSASDEKRPMTGVHLWAKSESATQPALHLLTCSQGGSVEVYASSTGPATPWERTAQWNVPANVQSTAVDEDGKFLAVGNQGTELSVWDLQTQQRAFLAKAGKPNRIGLVDPAHNTCVAFVPGTNARQVLVGTVKGKLRLYDTKVGRRPTLTLQYGEARINAIAFEPLGTRAWIATGVGQMAVLDIRLGKMLEALKGPIGSVRALAVHATEPLLASVGLDRFLRVHNTVTRRQLADVYLKQHLTGVAFCPAAAAAVEEHASVVDKRSTELVKKKGKKWQKSKEAV